MPCSTSVREELPTSDNVRSDNRFLGRWALWIGAAASAITAYIPGFVRHGFHAQGSTVESAASKRPLFECRTAEKEYRINDGGRVLKRSLAPHEYAITSRGDPVVPLLVVERLKNEVECMRFIQKHTDIPVPKILATYEEHGSYHLWTEFVDGVEMSELTDEEQCQIFPQNPQTLQIVAVIDWEYGGFFPREHETPFYESSEGSGIQITGDELKSAADQIIEFWKQSEISAG